VNRVLFAVVIAIFVDLLLMRAGARLDARMVVAPFLGALALTACGEWILARMRVTSLAAWLPAAFVTGTATTSIVIFALVSVGRLSAQTALLIWAAVVVASWIVWRPSSLAQSGSWLDIGSAVGFAAMCAYFCRDVAGFLPTAPTGGALAGWLDLYLHGTVIASFGDPLAIARGDIFLADAHRPFYHYGPFMLPAALLPSTGLPGLGLATAILLPLGLLTAALGTYAFAAELAGEGAALFAVLAIAFLPDASHYGMYNAFFGFHWLLITAPGSGYALGVAAVGCTCLMYGLRKDDRLPLMAGFLLLALLFLIRIHFFLLLAPALAGVAVLSRTRPRVRALVMCVVTALIVLALLTLTVSPAARALWVSLVEPAIAIDNMLRNGPDHFRLSFESLLSHSLGAALLVGTSMMLAAALGGFLIAYPVAAAWWCRSERREAIDLLPLLLCGSFLLLWLIAPVPAASDASEYKQRHFLLLYAMVGIWVVARMIQAVGGIKLNTRTKRCVGWLVFMCAIAAVMLLGRSVNPGEPAFRYMGWAKHFYNVKITPGLAQVARYIRDNSKPGDTLTMTGDPVNAELSGPLVELVSLSDVPAYLSRMDLLARKGGASVLLAKARLEQINKIVQSDNWASACETMRRTGIRWYVATDDTLPHWDAGKTNSVFREGMFSVYDAGSSGNSVACESASR
jgi:hypothetical protein